MLQASKSDDARKSRNAKWMSVLWLVAVAIFLVIVFLLTPRAQGQSTLQIGGTMKIGGTITCLPAQLPIFSPAPGTYTSTQNVSISCPNTCAQGTVEAFYTTDAEPPTIASTLFGSPISTPATITYTAMCACLGGTPGHLAYQTNLQQSTFGSECHVAPPPPSGGTITFPSGVSCTTSGGFGTTPVQPTDLVWTFPGGASPSVETITAPASSGHQVEALWTWLFAGGAAPSAAKCDSCTEEGQDIIIAPTSGAAVIPENEFDNPQFDSTHNQNRQHGYQCNQTSGKLLVQVDSGRSSTPGSWTDTTAACNFLANTKYHIVTHNHWIIGDTGCNGGNGCDYYDFIGINGLYTTLLGNYGGTQGFDTTSFNAWGRQDQVDMAVTGASPVTAGRTVYASTVALGYYGTETATVTGSYVISPLGAATPIIEPNAYSVGQYALAAPTPVLAFGKQGTGTSSLAIPISISNPSNSSYCTFFSIGCGTGSLVVTSMAVSGTNASDFTLTGSCGTIASNADCEPTVTFKPTAAANTAETGALTVNMTGATTLTLVLNLTGTSATVTTLATSACPTTLSASTNYQLSADITCAGTVFNIASTGIDLNLNGHTITYGNTSTASQVNVVAATNFNTQITVHNGTLASGAGTNTKGSTRPLSSIIGATGTNSYSPTLLSSFFNLHFNYNIQFANAIENSNGLIVVHDNLVTDTAVGNCGNVGCRSNLQATPFYEENVSAITPGATQFYNNTLIGGPQGGIGCIAPGCVAKYNSITPGNAAGVNTNNFAIYAWGSASQIFDNAIGVPVLAGMSMRGIQISGVDYPSSYTNANVFNNLIQTTEVPFNTEYSGCQHGGSYGTQIDDLPIGPNTFNNNGVTVFALNCAAQGLRLTASNYTTNMSQNTTYTAVRQAGAVTCNYGTWTEAENGCAYGIGIDGPTGDTTLNDTYIADNADVFFGPDGAPAASLGIFLRSSTFKKGANPASNWHFLVSQNGPTSSTSQVANVHIVDPTFGSGVAFTDTQIFAQGPNTGPVSVYEDWTQNMTVTKTSGPVAVGAVVTWTDTLLNTYTCTTDATGKCSVAVTQSRDNNDTAANQNENRNPYSLSIPFTGCTTYTQTTITVTATGTRNITLAGC